jgi:hypothetical protein
LLSSSLSGEQRAKQEQAEGPKEKEKEKAEKKGKKRPAEEAQKPNGISLSLQ